MSVRPLSTSLPGVGRWIPTWAKESVTAWGDRPVQPNTKYDSQPMTEPTMIAARPPGMPNGSRTPAVHDSRMIANVASAIHGGVEHLERRAHRDERHRDAGQRPEHRRARRVLPDRRADERADHDDDADEERPGEPGLPGLHDVAGPAEDRQHDHERHEEVVRHGRSVRHRRDVVAAFLPRELIRQVGVEQVAERQRDRQGRQDPAEDRVGRQLHDEQHERRQHEHVEQDVRAEAEECVPVARNPEPRPECAGIRGHVVDSLLCGAHPGPRVRFPPSTHRGG